MLKTSLHAQFKRRGSINWQHTFNVPLCRVIYLLTYLLTYCSNSYTWTPSNCSTRPALSSRNHVTDGGTQWHHLATTIQRLCLATCSNLLHYNELQFLLSMIPHTTRPAHRDGPTAYAEAARGLWVTNASSVYSHRTQAHTLHYQCRQVKSPIPIQEIKEGGNGKN